MPFAYDLLEPGLALSAAPESDGELAGLPFDAILNVADWGSPRYATDLCSDLHLVCRPFEDSVPAPLPFLTEAVLELAELRRRNLATLMHRPAPQPDRHCSLLDGTGPNQPGSGQSLGS